MNRRQFLLSAAGAGLTVAGAERSLGREATPQGLEVSILPTSIKHPGGTPKEPLLGLWLRSPPRLSVLLRNTSRRPISLWDDDNSWGFSSLSLEVVGLEDAALKKPIVVCRPDRLSWFGNWTSFSVLPPGAMVVRDVELAVPKENQSGLTTDDSASAYRGFPLSALFLRMRAVYQVVPDADSRKLGIWTGKIVSETHHYTLRL